MKRLFFLLLFFLSLAFAPLQAYTKTEQKAKPKSELAQPPKIVSVSYVFLVKENTAKAKNYEKTLSSKVRQKKNKPLRTIKTNKPQAATFVKLDDKNKPVIRVL